MLYINMQTDIQVSNYILESASVSLKMTSWLMLIYVLLIVVSFTDTTPTGACHLSTLTYNSGDIFTLQETGPCFKFKCSEGAVIPFEKKCHNPNDDSCHDEGTNVTDTNCFVMKCKKAPDFTFIQLLCQDDAGNCYNNGDTILRHHEGSQIKCTCSSIGFEVSQSCPEM